MSQCAASPRNLLSVLFFLFLVCHVVSSKHIHSRFNRHYKNKKNHLEDNSKANFWDNVPIAANFDKINKWDNFPYNDKLQDISSAIGIDFKPNTSCGRIMCNKNLPDAIKKIIAGIIFSTPRVFAGPEEGTFNGRQQPHYDDLDLNATPVLYYNLEQSVESGNPKDRGMRRPPLRPVATMNSVVSHDYSQEEKSMTYSHTKNRETIRHEEKCNVSVPVLPNEVITPSNERLYIVGDNEKGSECAKSGKCEDDETPFGKIWICVDNVITKVKMIIDPKTNQMNLKEVLWVNGCFCKLIDHIR